MIGIFVTPFSVDVNVSSGNVRVECIELQSDSSRIELKDPSVFTRLL